MEQYKKRGEILGKRTYDQAEQNPIPMMRKILRPVKITQNEMNEKDNINCWKCKGNHHPRKCPHLQQKCYFCGERRHIASSCPKRFGAICFICKKAGHISTNCPYRTNVSAEVPQGAFGKANPEDDNDNVDKGFWATPVLARNKEPIEAEDFEGINGENIWENDDIEEIGLNPGMSLLKS